MESEDLSVSSSHEAESNIPKGEIVYDAMNIEELDHFDIGAPVATTEISQMDVSVWPNNSDGRRRIVCSRRGSRVVNVSNPRKPHDGAIKGYLEDIDNIVVDDGPSTSKDVSRVFVSCEDPLQHLDWKLYSIQAEPFASCAQIILTEAMAVDSSIICSSVPQEFTRIGTFIIALHEYRNRHEITLDGLGAWGPPQNSSKYYRLDDTGKAVVCAADVTDAMRIICNRYVHMGTDSRGTFIRKTYTGIHENRAPSLFGVVVYDWEGTPHPVTLTTSTATLAGLMKEHAVGARSWEASVKTMDLESDEGATYRNQPIFNKVGLDFEAACRILLATFHIPGTRVCSRVPHLFRDCGTFVLDIKACGGERVLGRDGRDWNKPSGSSRYFRFDDEGKANRLDCTLAPPQSEYDVQITCKRYETIQAPGLLRKLYMAREVTLHQPRVNSHLAVLVYTLKPMNSKVTVAAGRQLMVGGAGDAVSTEESQGNMLAKSFHDFLNHSSSSYAPTAKRPAPDMSMQVEVNGSYVELLELKRMTIEKQIENQMRMSKLLDRAEAVFQRVEQIGSDAVPLVRELMGSWREEVVDENGHNSTVGV